MNKRERYRMSLAIVDIRRSKLERARMEALAVQHMQKQAVEGLLRSEHAMQACLAGLNAALTNAAGLSTVLVDQWMHATETSRDHWQRARLIEHQAGERVAGSRCELYIREKEFDDAQRSSRWAQRDYQKKLDEKRMATIEDQFMMQGKPR